MAYQTKPEVEALEEAPIPAVNAVPTSHLNTSTAADDYYQTVVITALLGILSDQSLTSQHHTVIEAIMSIFKTQGLKCVTFLPQVSPALLSATNVILTFRFRSFPLSPP